MSYSLFRHAGSLVWKRRPIQLTFFLTSNCNANCPFCFYLSGKRNDAVKTDELTLEEIKKVSASIGNLLWLAFSGGELFLREDLADIVRVFYKNNKPSIILLPTNGLMPEAIREKTEAILKQCRRSTVVVKLSLDGPEGLNDVLRGVKGAYQKTIATLNELRPLLKKYRNFELGINSVFCSKNQDYMKELFSVVHGLEGIKTHTVSLIRGDISDERLKEIDITKYYDTIAQMASELDRGVAGVYRFRGARLKAAQDILQRELIYKTMMSNKRLIPCYAGRLTLVLTETGDVYPCESFNDRLGNVRDCGYDITGLLETEEAREKIRLVKKGGCFCTHECYFMMNILFNPLMYAALLKRYLDLGFDLSKIKIREVLKTS